MRFRSVSDIGYDLQVYYHIACIVVGNTNTGAKYYEVLKDMHIQHVSELLNNKGFGDIEDTPKAMSKVLELIGAPQEFISSYETELTRFMVNFEVSYIPYYYSKIPPMESYLKKVVTNLIKTKIGKYIALTDDQTIEILSNFSEQVKAYSSKEGSYILSDSIVGYLVNTMTNFYIKRQDISDFIFKVVNQKGMHVTYDGEDYSPSDLLETEIVFKESIEFDVIASKIAKASALLYTHSGRIFYDLFSRYKEKLADRVISNINKILKDHSRSSGTPDVATFNNINIFGFEYEDKKYRNREMYLRVFDPIITRNFSAEQMARAIDTLIDLNEKKYLETGGKDQTLILSVRNLKLKTGGSLSNQERIQILVEAFCALRDLVKYLEKHNINVFEVKSAAFRSETVAKKFKDLFYYLENVDLVTNIGGEVQDYSSQQLISNSEVIHKVKEIIEMKRELLKGMSLSNIEDYLEHTSKKVTSYSPQVLTNVVSRLRQYNYVVRDKNLMVLQIQFYKTLQREFVKPFLESVKGKPVLARNTNTTWKLHQRGTFTELCERFNLKEAARYSSYFDNKLTNKKLPNQAFLDYLRYNEIAKLMQTLCYVIVDYLVEDRRSLVEHPNNSIKEQWSKLFEEYKSMSKFCSNRPMSYSTSWGTFLNIASELELFEVPNKVKSLDQISHLFDRFNVDLMIPEEGLGSIEEHVIFLFNYFQEPFADIFEYTNKLRVERFSQLQRTYGLLKESSSWVSTSKMYNVGIELYKAYDNTRGLENFKQFKQHMKVNKYGFLEYKGELYSKKLIGDAYYCLHEYGYWVRLDGSIDYLHIPVSPEDKFNE